MKRSKKLIALVVVLVVVAVVYAIIASRNPLYAPTETVEKETISEIDSDTITQISWQFGGDKITLVRGDAGWAYADDDKFPLNQEKVPDLLSEASKVKATQKLDNPEDLGEYGLTEPSGMITILTSDGNEINYYVGTQNTVSKEYYFTLNSKDTVYMIPTDLVDTFSIGLFDLIQPENIPSITNVKSFSIETESGLLSFYLTKNGDEETWYFDNGSDDDIVLDTEKTEDLLNLITRLDWTTYADYYAAEDELSTYGFDNSSVVTVNYSTTAETGAGETDYTLKLLIGGSSDDMRYAKHADSTIIHLIKAETVEQILSAKAEDLMP
jgi:hypothetical protein